MNHYERAQKSMDQELLTNAFLARMRSHLKLSDFSEHPIIQRKIAKKCLQKMGVMGVGKWWSQMQHRLKSVESCSLREILMDEDGLVLYG